MPPRAVWKGSLKVGELTCPVSLFTAVSTSERIAFHTLNRETGHRVHRQFVDSENGRPVSRDDQVKGYETGSGEYIVLEPEEIAAAIPDSDKTLAVQTFVICDTIDDVYLDRPYYITPGDKVGAQGFAVLRDGLRARKVAALAQTVLFRRMRTVLIRAYDDGLIATLLNFDYEVRSAKDAFASVPDIQIKGEMIDLAKHIIKTKMGKFDPKAFNDRYEEAVAEVVRAKIEGRKIKAKPEPAQRKVVDLMDALRESAKALARAKATKAKVPKSKTGSTKTAASAERRTVQTPSRRKAS
jgi:DNA end-binding protein Ku